MKPFIVIAQRDPDAPVDDCGETNQDRQIEDGEQNEMDTEFRPTKQGPSHYKKSVRDEYKKCGDWKGLGKEFLWGSMKDRIQDGPEN